MKYSQKRKQSIINCAMLKTLLSSLSLCHGFMSKPFPFLTNTRRLHRMSTTSSTSLSIYAPPGSGYATPEDEPLKLPSSYEPMMEYPGTMRPGRTPENMPFHDLPIADSDPVPIPWPHFQQIEWHHRWDPPHPHPIPMEVFIEMNGRWASVEDEAAMRAGARRDVRERRELAEDNRRSTVIMDDDEDDEALDLDFPMELGEGMFGALGSGTEEAITAAAVSKDQSSVLTDDEEDVEDDGSDDFDDFLLDLGLDAEVDDLLLEDTPKSSKPPAQSAKNLLNTITDTLGDDSLDQDGDDFDLDFDLGLMDDPDEGVVDIKMDSDDVEEIDEARAVAALSDDEDLDIGLDDDDEDLSTDGGMTMVPLEDFGDDSLLDDDDAFDDGGFDYDGDGFGDGGDGGDMW